MRFCLLALAIVAAAAAPAAASPESDVVATVHQFIDGFNRGDATTALAACATPASIVDEFAPHEWQGPNACKQWASDYDAMSKREGITGGTVTLGVPWHVSITGNRAYAVFPATYTYLQHGRRITESGSVFTVALQRSTAGWRITGWAWARH
jgi:hypothetical protein